VVFDDISQVITAQRSMAWGEVARRLAHEIKNPLTPIQLSAERLQRKLTPNLEAGDRELLDRATKTIVTQVEAMKHMVNDFRDYARLPPPVLASVALPQVLDEVLGLYGASRATIQVKRRNGETAVSLPPTLDDLPPVLGDANQIRQVLHNLLANAQDALAQTETPHIDIELAVEAARARLAVRDNGPGFAPEVLARAFEPYVTTKSKGTGLGLAIVKKIIDDHGGEIRVANLPGGGGEVTIWLPLV
jgi:nitrogen fixation/metabolism regulation signal transduction histidine kinase